ncbi:hypothetical protein [Pedomonas sp. V897]|uniref:hypothetical protein n=1 Tax=Pedomonas sp. V897 TaxID=3446482 RepID=UPI003EE0008A
MSRPGWPEALLLPGPAGAIPAIWRAPAPPAPNVSRQPWAALFVPPFAEEMNRTRRLMALTGMILAGHGVPSLLPDLPGTGDSPLPFSDATWESWIDSLHLCAGHLAAQGLSVRLVGIRLGGLLAADALAQGLAAESLALLDPVEDGRLHMRHWLRIRSAASLEIGPRITLSYLQTRLDNGQAVDVAGYDMSPALVNRISALKLAPLLEGLPLPVRRLDVCAPGTDGEPSASRHAIAAEAPWTTSEPGEPTVLAEALAALVLD